MLDTNLSPRQFFVKWEHAAIVHEILHEDDGHGTWIGYQLHQCADGVLRTAPNGKCECGATYCAECDEALQ